MLRKHTTFIPAIFKDVHERLRSHLFSYPFIYHDGCH